MTLISQLSVNQNYKTNYYNESVLVSESKPYSTTGNPITESESYESLSIVLFSESKAGPV